jgi:hypothetical protein
VLGYNLHPRANLPVLAVRKPELACLEKSAMSKDQDKARARAEATVQNQQRAAEKRAKATAEHAAQARAVDVNTARLKSLRLAKEAAGNETATKKSRHLDRTGIPSCAAW